MAQKSSATSGGKEEEDGMEHLDHQVSYWIYKRRMVIKETNHLRYCRYKILIGGGGLKMVLKKVILNISIIR